MTTTIGEKIRQLRKQKGYTLEKLAELTESLCCTGRRRLFGAYRDADASTSNDARLAG